MFILDNNDLIFSTIQIVSIAVFLIGLIAFIISFSLFYTYKTMLKKMDITVENLKVLAKHPISFKLNRVAYLATRNPDKYGDSFRTWKIEYVSLYFDKIPNLTSQTTIFFNTNSVSKRIPTIKNYSHVNELYEKSIEIERRIRDFEFEINKVLEEETLFRESLITLVDYNNQFLEELDLLMKDESFCIDKKIINNKCNNIKTSISNIESKLINVLTQEAFEDIKQCTTELTSFLTDLENLIKMDKRINTKLTHEMETLNIQINKNKEQNIIDSHYEKTLSSLNTFFAKQKKNIKDLIYKFDIKNAKVLLDDVTEQILDFSLNVSQEGKINIFIRQELDSVFDIFTNLKLETQKVEKLINFNKEMGIEINSDDLISMEQERNIDYHFNSFQNLYNTIKNDSFKQLDLMEACNKIITILKVVQKTLVDYRNVYSKLKSKKSYLVQIDQTIFDVLKILSATEVIIAKNKQLPALINYSDIITKEFSFLKDWKTQIEENKAKEFSNREQYNSIMDFLRSKMDNASKIKNDIFNEILLDRLVSASIAYLIRFENSASDFEEKISKCVELYEQKKNKEALNNLIDLIRRYEYLVVA